MLSEERKLALLHKYRLETDKHLLVLRRSVTQLGQDREGTTQNLAAMYFSSHTLKGIMGTLVMLGEDLAGLDKIIGQLNQNLYALQNGKLELDGAILDKLHQDVSRIEAGLSS